MILLICGALILAFYLGAQDSWALRPQQFELYTLWSSLLVHKDAAHLWVNVLGTLPAGALFEREHGRWKLLAFCAVTGPLSAIAELLAAPDYSGAIIGASGVSCALLGAFSNFNGWTKLLSAILFTHLCYSAWIQLPEIAHYTHLSGFIAGFIWSLSCSLKKTT